MGMEKTQYLTQNGHESATDSEMLIRTKPDHYTIIPTTEKFNNQHILTTVFQLSHFTSSK